MYYNKDIIQFQTINLLASALVSYVCINGNFFLNDNEVYFWFNVGVMSKYQSRAKQYVLGHLLNNG